MLVGVPLFCVACTIALVRYRLFDIDLVVNRSLVYLPLSGGLLAIYLGVVELARTTVGHGAELGGSLAAAALVAAVFVPCRAIVQRLVDRFMFGTRGDAAQTLSTLTASLESSVDDELSTALQALRKSLRLPTWPSWSKSVLLALSTPPQRRRLSRFVTAASRSGICWCGPDEGNGNSTRATGLLLTMYWASFTNPNRQRQRWYALGPNSRVGNEKFWYC